MFDWKIQGGKIIDGTGREPFAADVGGSGDRITAIDSLKNAEARNIIDASGCYVCPGFIDAHSHSDTFLLVQPSADSKIFQGVTTEIVGNCGASAAPIKDVSQLPFDWQLLAYPGKWQSMAEYFTLLQKCKPAVNVIALTGHNRLRIAVMGYENRCATADELRSMKRLLEQSLAEGAWGMSTGLIYRPGKYAAISEISDMASIVAQRNGIYTTHMRNEAAMVREAVAETIALARKTGVKIQISHLKTAGAANWRLVDEVLSMLAAARAGGLKIAADRYPYTYSCTDLDILLPDWLAASDRMTILAKLHDPDTCEKLRDELAADHDPEYWNGIIVATSTEEKWRGRSLLTIANTLGLEPVEAAIMILVKDELLTQAFYAGMSEENLRKIYSRPFVMIGSDASLRVPGGLFHNDHPHPRAYGTFTRFLRAALDGKTVPLAEAIRKMTSLPAEHFAIKQRGCLAAGNMADILVFDPAEVSDLSSYENPHQLSKGIKMVMVNGEVALDHGGLTGKRSGRVLAPQ